MWGVAASESALAPSTRVRLRAPDDLRAEELALASGAAGSVDATRQPATPQLDVCSSDYIEERLENLKRRPTWVSYLDQYVETFSDDDDEEAEPAERYDYDRKARRRSARRPENPSGLLASLTWSALVLAFSPLLLLLYPLLRHKDQGFWPMGCCSMGHLVSRSMANVLSLAFGVLLLYWAICRDLPELDSESVITQLDERVSHLLDAGFICQAAMAKFEVSLTRELCTGIGIDVAAVAATLWLILHCHRRWARYGMLAAAAAFFLDGPVWIYDMTFPAPVISRIDPTYAMVDEEISVAVDGQNLKPGGSIAWVSYWGCATTSDVVACEKQFSSVFSMGVTRVTFKSIDHFIPCYRDPPNPLQAQEYVCFSDVRIRVKDKRSIPGWSKIQQPTPAPAIAIVSYGAPSEVLDTSTGEGNQPTSVEAREYKGETLRDEASATLSDAAAVEGDDIDTAGAYPDQIAETASDNDAVDTDPIAGADAGLDDTRNDSDHDDLDVPNDVDEQDEMEAEEKLHDLSTNDEALHLSNGQEQTFCESDARCSIVEVADQTAEMASAHTRTPFGTIREESETSATEREASEFANVEARTEVMELLHAVEQEVVEEAAVDSAQVELVEVEVVAAGSSSVELVEEALSSDEFAQAVPESEIASHRLATEEASRFEVESPPSSRKLNASSANEDQETAAKLRDQSSASTAAKDGAKLKSAAVSSLNLADEVELRKANALADSINSVDTTSGDAVLTESRTKNSQRIVLSGADDKGPQAQNRPEPTITRAESSDEGITSSKREAPDLAAQAQDGGLKPLAREGVAQVDPRDRRRVDEREYPSVSSIRVDRRGSRGELPRPLRQPPLSG